MGRDVPQEQHVGTLTTSMINVPAEHHVLTKSKTPGKHNRITHCVPMERRQPLSTSVFPHLVPSEQFQQFSIMGRDVPQEQHVGTLTTSMINVPAEHHVLTKSKTPGKHNRITHRVPMERRHPLSASVFLHFVPTEQFQQFSIMGRDVPQEQHVGTLTTSMINVPAEHHVLANPKRWKNDNRAHILFLRNNSNDF